MINIKLTTLTLKRHEKDFKNCTYADNDRKNTQEHSQHEHYFKETLSPENLNKTREDEFALVWKNSWASMIRGDKDWYIKNRLIATNGVKKPREVLSVLRHGSKDFVNRYDKFREAVTGFGVAIICELFNMMFQDRFCLWTDKPSSKNNEYSMW
ncbi:MAG: hypothetical protein WCF23_09820 [Candidatus Nitrosopolaris sp.]